MTTSQMIRIAAVAGLVGLGVTAFMREGKPAPVIVTASPLVTAMARPVPREPRAAALPRESNTPAPVVKVAHKKLFTGEGHVEDPPGWSLPISCDRVRWYAAHFSEKTLNVMRIAAGLPEPTSDQKSQGRRCIAASGK